MRNCQGNKYLIFIRNERAACPGADPLTIKKSSARVSYKKLVLADESKAAQ